MTDIQNDPNLTTSGHRPIYQIAQEIRMDWGSKVNYAAKPYLDAMAEIDDIRDRYGYDDAQMVVLYFLSNARTWRGKTAKRIKVELNKMAKFNG